MPPIARAALALLVAGSVSVPAPPPTRRNEVREVLHGVGIVARIGGWRIVEVDLGDPAPERWREIVPEGPTRSRSSCRRAAPCSSTSCTTSLRG
jgi:hypothetical protein